MKEDMMRGFQAIGSFESLSDYIKTLELTDVQQSEISVRIDKIWKAYSYEKQRREEAEEDVHKAIIACGKLCDAMEPTRNKYKNK